MTEDAPWPALAASSSPAGGHELPPAPARQQEGGGRGHQGGGREGAGAPLWKGSGPLLPAARPHPGKNIP